MLSRLLFAALLALIPSLAFAQASPTGPFTPGHALVAVTPTGSLFADAGGAAGSSISGHGYLTEIGITNTGTPFCINDALISGAYHSLCFGANSLGGALVSYSANNGAAPLPLSFVINGSTFAFPGSANVVGPASSTIGDISCWGNTGGTLLRDGSSNSCTANTLSVTTQLNVSGAFTATGLVTNSDLVNPSVTINSTPCTLGSSCTISTSASTITDGTTTIASGATNTVLVNTGGALSHLATANNSVLVTNNGGVPSISSTLPIGLSATNMALTTPSLSGNTSGSTITLNGTAALNPSNGTLALGGLPSAVNFTGTGQAAIYADSNAGAVIQGQGGAIDVALVGHGTSTASCWVPTFGGTALFSCKNIGIQGSALPVNPGLFSPASDRLGFVAGSPLASIGYMDATGLNAMAIGASASSTGTFTTLSARGTIGVGAVGGTIISGNVAIQPNLPLVGAGSSLISTTTANGLVLQGYGNTNIFDIKSQDGTQDILTVPTGTVNLKSFGHIYAGGASPPVLTSCGTNPAISGDDKAGLVTMGTGSPTGCVITFATAYTSAPYCVVTWQATPLASQSYAISNTAITLTQTGTSSNKVNYMCMAQSGG